MKFTVFGIVSAAFCTASFAQTPVDPQQAAKDKVVRERTEGAAGGTGNPVAKGEGKQDAITGRTNLRDHRPKAVRERARIHDESSSDREKGRGARGNP